MTKEKNATAGSSGLGFGTILGLIFITLKLCGIIEWSWLWVVSPFWISGILVICAVFTLAYIQAREENKALARKREVEKRLRDLE